MTYFKYNGKNIYVEEVGNGPPLLLLHGNTASSKMFREIIDLYQDDFRLILMDFLGHGKSDRLDKFPVDFWYDEAMQAIALLDHHHYGKVNVIGTSGGALAALNVALERGDLVNKVIADSFEGEEALDIVAEIIPDDRKQSKLNQDAIAFWYDNHGSDWENIIDNDTKAMLQHHQQVKRFFHRDLSQLRVPVMLTASLADEFAAFLDFPLTYERMQAKIPNGKLHFFPTGGHPAMLSNGEAFFLQAKQFFQQGQAAPSV